MGGNVWDSGCNDLFLNIVSEEKLGRYTSLFTRLIVAHGKRNPLSSQSCTS